MSTISLKKLSITVVVASLASNIVFASSDINKVLPKAEQSAMSFSQLIASYDVDKNNALSAKELSTDKVLSKNFKKVDTNGDQQISEQEFNIYLDNMKKSLS